MDADATTGRAGSPDGAFRTALDTSDQGTDVSATARISGGTGGDFGAGAVIVESNGATEQLFRASRDGPVETATKVPGRNRSGMPGATTVR